MDFHEGETSYASRHDGSLKDKLAEALPQDSRFTINHISTPPTKCAAIFAAPPGQKPQKTYCESHFLTVSITPPNPDKSAQLLVLAIEVLIYTTATLTTLFVSKADSTGYLHLLNLQRSRKSPFKSVATIFLKYLADTRQRPGIRLVISLFARAQDQYLFPGSIENTGKHVLDDKGLVKWWCQVLDPVLRSRAAEVRSPDFEATGEDTATTVTTQGYLIVPGFDKYETIPFFPSSFKSDPPEQKRWTNSHPLRELSNSAAAPPRCLIPHFPDDPKSRFLDELDEEIYGSAGALPSESPMKRASMGRCKSVKTLEQFWEMMAFRQECSSGRLVGFIWIVFTPSDLVAEAEDGLADSQASILSSASSIFPAHHRLLPTPSHSQTSAHITTPQKRPHRSVFPLSPRASSPVSTPPDEDKASTNVRDRIGKAPTKGKRLTGPIIPRQPRIKVARTALNDSELPNQSKYFLWPKNHREQVILEEQDYKRVLEVLLRVDFANEEIACTSTRRWIDEVALAAGTKKDWGYTVIGTRPPEQVRSSQSGGLNTLTPGLIRKKKKDVKTAEVETVSKLDSIKAEPQIEASSGDRTTPGVNLLGGGLIRKKPKA